MSFFNDAQRDGLLTGRYICSECGGLMEFEDEWEDMTLSAASLLGANITKIGQKPIVPEKQSSETARKIHPLL